MATNIDARPVFYEDQYLGADDLDTAVGYGRAQLARHSLGAHTWGIAVGLEIVEKPVPGLSGQVDNYLTPGYAWDGFGRMITVLAPYKLPPDLFTSYKFNSVTDTGGKGRMVEVWLRYWEDNTQAEADAYAPCEAQGRTLRALESFRFVVGSQNAPESQVLLNGQSVDAEAAVQKSNPSGILLNDHSVPFQDWPADEVKTIWLVPVGYVRWQPVQGGSGFFVPSDPVGDLAATSAFRHYSGVVAGQVEAAAGVLQLHDRSKPYSTVRTSELVWVEGDLRVKGDVRPFGKALDFRDDNGQRNDSTEMLVRRIDVPGKTSSLQVVIGHDKNGANSLSVGPLDQGGNIQPKLTVLDNGNVGIGTANPKLTLDIQGDFGRTDGAATVNLYGSQIGEGADGILFLRNGGRVVAFDGGDNIGIGVTAPTGKLTIKGNDLLQQGLLSIFSQSSDLEYDGGSDGLFVIRNTGTTTAFIGGNIGIGTVAPSAMLEVAGSVKFDGKQLVPIHRYYNATSGDHFYSKSAILPLGYTDEGVEFYAFF